jgi:DNA-binding response OmpR family regulator
MSDKLLLNATSAGNPRAAGRSLRVLVADDDRDSVLTLMMLLREEGHEVRGVHNGHQVLKAVNEFGPHAVILDIAMPELTGWEAARKLNDRPGRRPLLIGISGQYKSVPDRILSEIIGFDHYLVKPYAPDALLALLAPLRLPQNDEAAG